LAEKAALRFLAVCNAAGSAAFFGAFLLRFTLQLKR
jgi:hypothetical protein